MASLIGGTSHICDHSNNDFGCVEANTNQRKWFIPCCKNEKCHLCNGTGKIYPIRCPVHYYDEEVITLRYLYESYEHKNILPFSGSPIEQPKVLFESFDLINHYLYVFNKVKEEQREDNKRITGELKRRLSSG